MIQMNRAPKIVPQGSEPAGPPSDLRGINIDLLEQGVEVTCSHKQPESSGTSGGTSPAYVEPKRYAFATVDEAMKFVTAKLGGGDTSDYGEGESIPAGEDAYRPTSAHAPTVPAGQDEEETIG